MKIIIDDRFADWQVKAFLASFHLGKEKIKNLNILVNGLKASLETTLKRNDEVELIYEDTLDFLPLEGHLDVLYEDDNLLIVNKGPHMLVHPDDKNKNGTLANLVAYYYMQKKEIHAVRYLHRIDYDTTGIVIFCKDILTASSLAFLNEHFAITKKYLCIASGKFLNDDGIFDYPIAEDRHIANKKRVSKTGKEAITYYHVLERLNKNLNLCEATLKTGRTHQIRLHFSYSGHPLVGDKLYNGNPHLLNRQALHAYEVSFVSPVSNKIINIQAPIPADLKKLYNKYKKRF